MMGEKPVNPGQTLYATFVTHVASSQPTRGKFAVCSILTKCHLNELMENLARLTGVVMKGNPPVEVMEEEEELCNGDDAITENVLEEITDTVDQISGLFNSSKL